MYEKIRDIERLGYAQLSCTRVLSNQQGRLMGDYHNRLAVHQALCGEIH